MSYKPASSHLPSELSPPASPSSKPLSNSDAAYGQITTRNFPTTPPTSVSPSHRVDDLDQASPRPYVLNARVSATQSAGDMAPPSSIPTHADAPRTSSKHRLDDEDTEDEPNKRRRTDHDRNEASKQNDLTAEEDVGGGSTLLYRLSNQPVATSRPHPTENLFSLYRLEPLAATVARRDPLTGEKINKLRKSYEGKVKDFPGKNKAVDAQRELFDLITFPEDVWDVQHVQGKEITSALSADGQGLSTDFLEKLESALDMSTGPLPAAERDKWRSIIDLESAEPKPQVPDGHAVAQTQDVRQRVGRPPLEEPQRPKRRGTKRNYNDDAFEGYAEGYADDYLDELAGDPMDVDDDRRSSVSGSGTAKRRRKDQHFASTLPQYSPGPVSVGGNGR